jgi:hypothetical protein
MGLARCFFVETRYFSGIGVEKAVGIRYNKSYGSNRITTFGTGWQTRWNVRARVALAIFRIISAKNGNCAHTG